jgi:predicted MPP superfamily phosphohydrolase
MLKLLHISDLHFGPPFLPAVAEAVLRAADELAPDIVVASGDFTQRAKRRQYADARAFLERLPAVPRVVVPGNHDVPLYRVFERLFRPYANYRQYISDELETVLARDDAVIVALNTTSLDLYPSKSRASGIIIAQCGTTTSRRGRAREREKNSFNLITIGGEVTEITHYLYFHDAGGFAPFSRHTFPRRQRHCLGDL